MTRHIARRRQSGHHLGRHRRGTILVLAMVCVAITMSIMMLLVRSALSHHAAQTTHVNAAQANWLVESGFERATAKLAVDPSYTGETWEILPGEFGETESDASASPAVVRIEVEPAENGSREREIHVTADYPNSTAHRVRRGKQIVVQLVAPESDETEIDGPESDSTN